MRPRPRSRKSPIEYVPPDDLAAQILAMRHADEWPEVVLVGRREWEIIRTQPEAARYLGGLISEELTFCGLPVIVWPRWARPKVCTKAEYEDAVRRG